MVSWPLELGVEDDNAKNCGTGFMETETPCEKAEYEEESCSVNCVLFQEAGTDVPTYKVIVCAEFPGVTVHKPFMDWTKSENDGVGSVGVGVGVGSVGVGVGVGVGVSAVTCTLIK